MGERRVGEGERFAGGREVGERGVGEEERWGSGG